MSYIPHTGQKALLLVSWKGWGTQKEKCKVVNYDANKNIIIFKIDCWSMYIAYHPDDERIIAYFPENRFKKWLRKILGD